MCISTQLSLDDYPEFKNKDVIHYGWKIMENGKFPVYATRTPLCHDCDNYPQVEKETWHEAKISEWHAKNLSYNESYLPAFHLFLTKEDAASYWLMRESLNMRIVPILFKEVKAIGLEDNAIVVAAKHILFIQE